MNRELTESELNEISLLRCQLLDLAHLLEGAVAGNLTPATMRSIETHVSPVAEQFVFGDGELLRALRLVSEGRCRVCHETTCICTERHGQEETEEGDDTDPFDSHRP